MTGLGRFLATVALSLTASAETAINAVCVDSSECKVTGTLTLRAVNDPAITWTQSIKAGLATVTLDDRAREWEIELTANGFWMARTVLQTATPGDQKLTVWRTTRLRGHFRSPGNAELPKIFDISAQSPFGTRGPVIAEGTRIQCPINSDGTWTCTLPAARMDLAFRVKGFTPHYQWDVKLRPGIVKNLGTVALRRGASLVAWLDPETLEQLEAPAHARVTLASMLVPSPVAQQLSKPLGEGTFNERGMVQLAPLPAGTYSLEVIAPGFATATIPHIEMYEGKESTLRHPIRLEPPLSIQVSVKPARDAQDKPWGVRLSREAELSNRFSDAGRGQTDDTGMFTSGGQAPGKYHVVVLDSKGNRFASRSFTVHGAADARLAVDLANLLLHGRVRIGDVAVPATLRFGGNGGAQQVTAKANHGGEFDIVLPRAGEWYVDIREDNAKIRSGKRVTVEADEPIAIDLPDTEIAGWVVGPDGDRVASAQVAIVMASDSLDQQADATGAFRFRGVTPGTTRITARNLKTGEFSRVVEVDVKEDARTEGIQLELDGLRRLRGALFCNGQPVVGAGVTGYGLSGGMARMAQAVSGLEGEFELSFPTTAPTIMLIVASPGRTLQAYTVSQSEDPIRLELAPVGGTIRLSRPDKATRPLLVYDGTDIPMHHLAEWARAHGTSLAGFDFEIPALAPGPYRFCADVGETRTCREGLLARGGSLTLAID